jgi:hypothetical protein
MDSSFLNFRCCVLKSALTIRKNFFRRISTYFAITPTMLPICINLLLSGIMHSHSVNA